MTESGNQPPVAALFEETASYWRDVYAEPGLQGCIYRERQAAVLAMVEKLTAGMPRRVVEVGCGAGRLTIELARRGHAVEAIDLSPAMVAHARARVREAGLSARVQVRVGDLLALPLPPAAADVVVAVGVLPWLADAERGIGAMAALLAPGGHLVLTADNRARLTTFIDPRSNPLPGLLRRARRRLGSAADATTDATVSRKYLPSRVDRMLVACGLRPVERASVGFGPFTFWDRPVIGDVRGVALHRRLQRLADRGVPGLRGTGWHYVVAAQLSGAAHERA